MSNICPDDCRLTFEEFYKKLATLSLNKNQEECVKEVLCDRILQEGVFGWDDDTAEVWEHPIPDQPDWEYSLENFKKVIESVNLTDRQLEELEGELFSLIEELENW